MRAVLAAAEDTNAVAALPRYLRTANYLAGAQIYLQDNVQLREPLRPEHIKDRLLGHWGTCPGINLIYAHLNRVILRDDLNTMLVTGPGHGAPANLANLYLEGTLHDFYPELTFDASGLRKFVRAFSWPGGFPSHLYPGGKIGRSPVNPPNCSGKYGLTNPINKRISPILRPLRTNRANKERSRSCRARLSK